MQPKSAYAPNRHKYTVDARAAERVKRAHAPTHALYHARSIMACTVFHVESIELHLMTNARLNCIHARKILVNTQMQTRTSCMRVSTCAAHVYTELAIPVHILGHNAGTHATFCVRACVCACVYGYERLSHTLWTPFTHLPDRWPFFFSFAGSWQTEILQLQCFTARKEHQKPDGMERKRVKRAGVNLSLSFRYCAFVQSCSHKWKWTSSCSCQYRLAAKTASGIFGSSDAASYGSFTGVERTRRIVSYKAWGGITSTRLFTGLELLDSNTFCTDSTSFSLTSTELYSIRNSYSAKLHNMRRKRNILNASWSDPSKAW